MPALLSYSHAQRSFCAREKHWGANISRFVLAVACAIATPAALAGPLTPPPGPPSSTGKSLSEIERGIPISASNTPGDSNSLFRISAPGSYYLTQSIFGVPAATSAIEIAASDVVIDLNGHSINGSFSVTETTPAISSFGPRNVVVKNGSIKSWQSTGISAGNDGRVSNVHFDVVGGVDGSVGGNSAFIIEHCTFRASTHIRPQDGTIIHNCRFRDMTDAIQNPTADNVTITDVVVIGTNGETSGEAVIRLGDNAVVSRVAVRDERRGAIRVGANSVVSESVFTGATTGGGMNTGVRVGDASIVRDTLVSRYGLSGIFTGDDCRITSNVSLSNGGAGIATGWRCLITGNLVTGNRSGFGIQAGLRCMVMHNHVEHDVVPGYAIRAFDNSTVFQNVAVLNGIQVVGQDSLVDGNRIVASQGPSIVAGDGCLVIRNVYSGGGLAFSGFATFASSVSGSAIDTAGPFSNIEF